MTSIRRVQFGSWLFCVATFDPNSSLFLGNAAEVVGLVFQNPSGALVSELQREVATDSVALPFVPLGPHGSALVPSRSKTYYEEPTRCPATSNKYSISGAFAFSLVFVPILFILGNTCLQNGIVVVAGEQQAQTRAPIALTDGLLTDMAAKKVLVASIEHDFVQEFRPGGKRSKATAGGLGKVAGQLQLIHPTDLISVHPVYGKDTVYGFEPGQENDALLWQRVPHALELSVDDVKQKVEVFKLTVHPPDGERSMPIVTYLLLEHPWFRNRPNLYLEQPGSRKTLCFFSLWNQAVGALIAMTQPEVYQCPDYHTALAPWYALRACGSDYLPPRVAVILHNAEYQGAITSQHLLRWQMGRLAKVFDLPASVMRKYMMAEGGFNMLQAAVSYTLLMQHGKGVCAVSEIYAEESKLKHRVLWPLPQVQGLPNPMLESELPPTDPQPLAARRREAKNLLYAAEAFRRGGQTGFGYLERMENARIFGFVGRWVKQKGLDFVADIVESLLAEHQNLQLVFAGPVGDAYGSYTELKLTMLAKKPTCEGRLKVLPLFFNMNEAVGPTVKYAFDFCFMPSRDEPFGYVDIEFGWFGALTVGAMTGGLGKMPGIYYLPSNVSSPAHICTLLTQAVRRAMKLSDLELLKMAERATEYRFPVVTWQRSLLALYVCTRNPSQQSYNLMELRDLFRSKTPLQTRLLIDSDRPSFSHRVVGEPRSSEHRPESYMETEELQSFIRPEVGDDAIRSDVQRLVEEQGHRRAKCCCANAVPAAQTVLDVTQWNAMRRGEYEEGGLAIRAPFFGLCRPVTSRVTSWLAGECFGIKRIDLFILVEFFEAPFLQTFWTEQLKERSDVTEDLLKLCGIVYTLTNCISTVLWTRVSMNINPNICMAVAVALRIPLAFVNTVMVYLPGKFNIVVFFMLLGSLAGGDSLFVFYGFLGTSVGDISRLALRMGTCYGVYAAMSFVDQAVVIGINKVTVLALDGISWKIYVWSVIGFKGILALLYMCAPAPYREFHFPEWDFKAITEHRRTLMFLRRGIIASAITTQAVSGAAVLHWRTEFEPLRSEGFLSFDRLSGRICYEFMPFILALATILWSYLIFRIPNKAMCVIKSCAFLLAPAALPYSLLALFVGDDTTHLRVVDTLLVLSTVLDTVRMTSIYIAILSVVGSRWRFISFMVSTLFFQGLLQTVVKVFLALQNIPAGPCASDFARTWMPVIAIAALVEWALVVWGFRWFDQESQMLLTESKKGLLRENRWGRSLRRLRRALDRPAQRPFDVDEVRISMQEPLTNGIVQEVPEEPPAEQMREAPQNETAAYAVKVQEDTGGEEWRCQKTDVPEDGCRAEESCPASDGPPADGLAAQPLEEQSQEDHDAPEVQESVEEGPVAELEKQPL